jgi:A/G-specific adenine glycosylase
LAWFDAHCRPLAWRETSDPYKVWVSEIMLQQTRVDTVSPYYERWLQRFPTVHALAQADEEEVLGLWSGLGYYSRARNLHKAAKILVAHYDAKVPREHEALVGLPGVGAYTAGAVASIAHAAPVPAVDGNALRVLSRWTATKQEIDRTATQRNLTETAARLVDPQRPGHWNQAVMELGSLVCTPRNPDCKRCPVRRYCSAYGQGIANELPKSRPKRAVKTQEVHFALIADDSRLLLTKRPEAGLLAGTWGLPGGDVDTPLGRFVREQTGLRVQKGRKIGEASHRFTHRQWHMQVYACRLKDHPESAPTGNVRWVRQQELESAPLATATRKAIALAR